MLGSLLLLALVAGLAISLASLWNGLQASLVMAGDFIGKSFAFGIGALFLPQAASLVMPVFGTELVASSFYVAELPSALMYLIALVRRFRHV